MAQEPYRPSWQNLFFRAIQRSPLPNGAIYLLIFIGIVVLNQWFLWIDRQVPWGTVDSNQLNYWIWSLLVLVATDYLLSSSRDALDRFRPALDVGDEAYARLAFRFRHLSWRDGWIATLLAVVVSVPLVPTFLSYPLTSVSGVAALTLTAFQLSLVFFTFGLVLRTVRMVEQLYARVDRINLFHLEPLYSLSGLTSRVGIVLVIAGVLSYLTNFTFADRPQIGPFLFFFLIDMSLAVLVFLLPLRRMHRRLAQEKERLNAENGLRLEQALRTLHRRSDEGDWNDMAGFRDSIASLLEYRREIKSISTWPWESATLRGFLTALFLPIVLWLIQQGLSRMLAA
jgi:uncharacterized membrane protein HdeD (DUF308 family)